MSLRILIVDDEPLARDTVRLLLDSQSDVEIVGEARNGTEAVQQISSLQPDLVFLDIQMPGLNGFEVIKEVGAENMPVVIFATAFDEYALKAFEAQALDYLLKPYDDDRFEAALDRGRARVEEQRIGKVSSELVSLMTSHSERKAVPVATGPEEVRDRSKRILIKERDSVFFVKTENIDWVEAAKDYVVIHVGQKKHLLRESMTRMEKRLDPSTFVRIHRSSIVNVERIKELKAYFHGDYIVYMNDGSELKLSRRYWSRVEHILGASSSKSKG
jgi:two-component system, LytTR family, response regulator